MKSSSKSSYDKPITQQIMMRVGRSVLLVFIIIATVSVFMMNTVLKNAKETELTLESQSMSNHLSEFFITYARMTEQLAVNPEVREVLRETDASTGTTILSIASPIYDDDRTVLGVAGMDISMTKIISII